VRDKASVLLPEHGVSVSEVLNQFEEAGLEVKSGRVLIFNTRVKAGQSDFKEIGK
jgi:hypothetical protein